MLKTHKIALNPNNVQATQFAQHCGYARVAYNHALADFKEGLATCGAKDKDLSLSDRTYHCSDCGHVQDRDLNAAINLRTVAVGHTETQNVPIYRGGDFVSPHHQHEARIAEARK